MPLLVWFSIENDSLLIAPQKPQVPATVRGIKRKLPGTLFVSPWQSISSGGVGGIRTHDLLAASKSCQKYCRKHFPGLQNVTVTMDSGRSMIRR